MKLRRAMPIKPTCVNGVPMTDGCLGMGWAACDTCSVPLPAATPAVHREAEQEPDDPHLVKLLRNVCHYADSVCGMLRSGGWPGKAEALESRIKAVIEYDAANPFKTHAPEGISYDHLLELAKMSGLVGAYSVRAVNDKIVGYARVVLNDVAVQEAFVRANWAAPLPRASDAAQPDERATFDLTDREWLDVFERVKASVPNVFGSYMKAHAAFAREAIRLADAARATAPQADQRMSDAPRTTPYQWRDTGPLETGEPS